MRKMWRHVLLAVSVLFIVGMSPALAQDVERFGDKLGELPVDGATTDMIAGTGQVSATLSGNQLQVTGTFEGLLSPAVAAHIHQGAPGIPGPVVLELSVNNATSGVVNGSFELTDEEIELLRAANFYVQIHSEQNPGGVIRGWLMPQ